MYDPALVRQQLQAAYLAYTNNYLTREKFAEHHHLTLEQATALINLGREVHEDIVKEYRELHPA